MWGAYHVTKACFAACLCLSTISVLQELNEQKNELLQKVQVLRKDLEDWRSKLETQVKNYKTVSAAVQLSFKTQSLELW